MNMDRDFLEPATNYVCDDENPALASIAVSLKRIADYFESLPKPQEQTDA